MRTHLKPGASSFLYRDESALTEVFLGETVTVQTVIEGGPADTQLFGGLGQIIPVALERVQQGLFFIVQLCRQLCRG